MPGRVNGFSLAYTALGGVVLWSGIKGETLSATFRGLLAGQAPNVNQEPVTGTSAGSTPAAPGTGSTIVADTGASSPQAAANQAIAKLLAAPYGWSTGVQWTDLVALWNQESGWSATAVNPSSGATGIPQLNPEAHTIPPGWSSAAVQIAWGLNYIKVTYGSPAAAWAHEQANGWY